MADLNEIEVFAAVVKAGSFTRAAQALKMPKSTVSRKVSQLEERLGVALLRRTTRKLDLTDVGNRYYRSCSGILAELAEAEAAVRSAQEAPRGLLRITAPAEFGAALLEEPLRRFLKAHKEVQVELLLTDRIVDLLEEGVDVAIRAGALADSTLVARKLGMSEFRLFASPAYLKRAGTPSHPKQLADHACLTFTSISENGVWELESGKSHLKLKVESRIISSQLGILHALAQKGEGVAQLPDFMARESQASGKLVRVLPEWHSARDPYFVVYPAQRFLSPKLKAFLSLLREN